MKKSNREVLITDGPPWGILDQTTPDGGHLGCEELLKAVEEKERGMHVFGHNRGGAGCSSNRTARFVKAAYLNENYEPLDPAGKVQVIDL